MLRGASTFVFCLIANYVAQLQMSKLIISRYIIRKQQESMNNIIMSWPEGLIVFKNNQNEATKNPEED